MLWEQKVIMKGLQGSERIKIPSNLEFEIQFITIVNITDNSVCIYSPLVSTPVAGQCIVCLGAYSAMTIPVLPEIRKEFNLVWTNPGGTNLNYEKIVRLFFTKENLAYNNSFAPSFAVGSDVFNTAIVADNIGLAKAIQLPSSLTADDNLKVALLEPLTASGNLKVALLEPLTASGNLKVALLEPLTASGNLKTAIVESLPAGTNVIGALTLAGSEQTLLASEARTASDDTSLTPVDVKKYKEANFFLDVTAVSGTEPTLDVVIKTKDPVSGKWFNIVTFTQVTAITSEMKTVNGNLGSLIAVFYTIDGTSPDFTFSVGAVLK